MNENRKLTGKIAIVFGGSRGIGAAAARRLASEGADVAVTYLSAPERAAEIIVRGVAKGRARILVGMDAKVGSLIERLMPVSYWSLLGRALQ